ncbi:unnamed protein product [Rhodiola kirilowii]
MNVSEQVTRHARATWQSTYRWRPLATLHSSFCSFPPRASSQPYRSIDHSKYLRLSIQSLESRAVSESQRSSDNFPRTVMEKDNSFDTDIDVSSADEATPAADKTSSRRPKKNEAKVPKKINKSRREKVKREQLNDLFLDLAKALGIKEPNNGKAIILTEAARFLNGMVVHVDGLRKENKTLTSESQYVTVEKEELQEDNSLLLSEVEKLRAEIESKKLQSQAPPPDVQLLQPPPLLSKDHFSFSIPDATLGQPHPPCPILVFPFSSDYPTSNNDHPITNPTSDVIKPCKPCPRYPDQTGLWQSRILEEQLRVSKSN